MYNIHKNQADFRDTKAEFGIGRQKRICYHIPKAKCLRNLQINKGGTLK